MVRRCLEGQNIKLEFRCNDLQQNYITICPIEEVSHSQFTLLEFLQFNYIFGQKVALGYKGKTFIDTNRQGMYGRTSSQYQFPCGLLICERRCFCCTFLSTMTHLKNHLLALPPIQRSIQAGCTEPQNLEDSSSKERQHLPTLASAIVASGCSIKMKTGEIMQNKLRMKAVTTLLKTRYEPEKHSYYFSNKKTSLTSLGLILGQLFVFIL